MPGMKITSLAQWYGCNRMKPQRVGKEVGKVAWCGIPFCGALPEAQYIETRSGIANDRHRHLINLASVVADPDRHRDLIALLEPMLFHPDKLKQAQHRCKVREDAVGLFENGCYLADDDSPEGSLLWAADYFVCSWMGYGARCGQPHEFKQSLSVRWTSSGGDSAKRFRSAIESLPMWHDALKNWQFECIDGFEFIARSKDEPGHALYVDAPWWEHGRKYTHAFKAEDHGRLAVALKGFHRARVVLRYGDVPQIRALYPEPDWTWIVAETRDQQNNGVREALIINGPAYGAQ